MRSAGDVSQAAELQPVEVMAGAVRLAVRCRAVVPQRGGIPVCRVVRDLYNPIRLAMIDFITSLEPAKIDSTRLSVKALEIGYSFMYP